MVSVIASILAHCHSSVPAKLWRRARKRAIARLCNTTTKNGGHRRKRQHKNWMAHCWWIKLMAIQSIFGWLLSWYLRQELTFPFEHRQLAIRHSCKICIPTRRDIRMRHELGTMNARALFGHIRVQTPLYWHDNWRLQTVEKSIQLKVKLVSDIRHRAALTLLVLGPIGILVAYVVIGNFGICKEKIINFSVLILRKKKGDTQKKLCNSRGLQILTGHDQTGKLSASLQIEIMQFVFVSSSGWHFFVFLLKSQNSINQSLWRKPTQISCVTCVTLYLPVTMTCDTLTVYTIEKGRRRWEHSNFVEIRI